MGRVLRGVSSQNTQELIPIIIVEFNLFDYYRALNETVGRFLVNDMQTPPTPRTCLLPLPPPLLHIH